MIYQRFVAYRNLPNGPVLAGRGSAMDSGISVQCDPKDETDFILGIKMILAEDFRNNITLSGLEVRKAR